MNKVRIDKNDLLAIVQANREKHYALFERALEGYRVRAVQELERRIADLKASKPVNISVMLEEPVNRTEDYDRVIRMLELSVDVYAELTEADFNNYVMDNWGWKQHAFATNTMYAEGASFPSELGG